MSVNMRCITTVLIFKKAKKRAFGALTLLVGGRKGIRPVKNWVVGCWRGYLSGARCRLAYMAQLMPLPLTVSCFNKIQIVFTFLVPAHPASPRERAVKRLCVCVCVCVCVKKSTVSNSQNVKDSSHGNKCLWKIKINLRSKVEICISTYSNVDVVSYNTPCRTELKERNCGRQIVESLKINFEIIF